VDLAKRNVTVHERVRQPRARPPATATTAAADLPPADPPAVNARRRGRAVIGRRDSAGGSDPAVYRLDAGNREGAGLTRAQRPNS